MLVCVGACLIMMTNQYINQVYSTGDPVRMGAQVVSGIGFLGAGTIVVTKRNQIRGLTTAAGLWAAAAVGLALGIGFYEAAVWSGGVIFVVLTVMQNWDSRMHRNSKNMEVYVELNSAINLGAFIRRLREFGMEIDSVQMEHDAALENDIQFSRFRFWVLLTCVLYRFQRASNRDWLCYFCCITGTNSASSVCWVVTDWTIRAFALADIILKEMDFVF